MQPGHMKAAAWVHSVAAWVHRVAGGEQPRRTCSQAEAFHSARVCSHGTAHALCAAAAKSSALRKTVPVCGASRSSRAT